MKKFIVYLLVIICTVSLGFAIFYLVRDNEVISISSASMYKDVGEKFTLDVDHVNKKKATSIVVTSSNDDIVSGEYNVNNGQYNATANAGGVARINVRTSNAKFRNLWCDVIVGDGSVETPFYISTAEQLAAIGMGPATGEKDEYGRDIYAGAEGYEKYHSNLCYKLVSNVDASTINDGFWVPLRNFTGRFDGNGLTISNIYISASEYHAELGDKADEQFQEGKPAGLFASIGYDSVVYNLKIDNFIAKGNHSEFGVIAGINMGVIERIEVKNAMTDNLVTDTFGGLVGVNESVRTPIYNEDESAIIDYKTHVARLDRCSVKINHGQTTLENGTSTITTGATGTIGGLVGHNHGGTIAYCYAKGNIFFGDNSKVNIVYGGLVGQNEALLYTNVPEIAGLEKYEGAHIKDCYSDLTTTLQDVSVGGVYAGAVAKNIDFKVGDYESDHVVNNYMVGVYYNKDNLNLTQEGIDKEFKGIAQFTMDSTEINFADTQTIVYGLTADEMKDEENFISHMTKTIEFNEDGSSKGVVYKNVYWLFDSVWVINEKDNDGKPFLNYQLSYIPDDFRTVGIPVVHVNDKYYFAQDIDYPISILSGENGSLRIRVGEYYQLKYSPTGINITWKSSDSSVVEVDSQGRLKGLKVGVVTVTATTKTGSTDTINVIVENINYVISNYPNTIYLYQGDTYDLSQIKVTPALPSGESLTFTLSPNGTNVASISGMQLKASTTTTGSCKLTISYADTQVTVNVVVMEKPTTDLTIEATTDRVEGYYESIAKTGSITISNTQGTNVSYTCDNNKEFLDLTWSGNVLNYKILGAGSTVVRVRVNTTGYAGYVDIYFNIKETTDVTLNVSSALIEGYIEDLNGTVGSITVSNSVGAKLSYIAKSSNTSVVVVTNTDNNNKVNDGNLITYQIKGKGEAYITIEVAGEDYRGIAVVNFRITNKPTVIIPSEPDRYVDLAITSASIYVGESITLSATTNADRVEWVSDNASIATVDKNTGKVVGVSAGRATITAKAYVGTNVKATATCVITVKAKPVTTTISVTPSSASIYVGDTKKLTVTATNYDTIEWVSADTSIATVSNGVVTGIKVGSVQITAKAKVGGSVKVTDFATITVKEKPVTISLSMDSTSVVKGTDAIIKATLTNAPAGATVEKWTLDGVTVSGSSGNTLAITTESLECKTYYVTAIYKNISAEIAFTVQEDTTYSKYIRNIVQLNAVRYHLDEDYILAASFSVGEWTPIGTEGAPFTGTFLTEGNAVFTLSGINVASGTYSGLFGYTEGARIENVKIQSSNIKGKYAAGIVGYAVATDIAGCSVYSSNITATQYAGGIAGYTVRDSIISDCIIGSTTTIISTGNTGYAGGIAGRSIHTTLDNHTVSGNIQVSGCGYAGGVVGYTEASVKNSLVTATISTPTNNANNFVGGIVGFTSASMLYCTVRNSTITGYNAGGFAGEINVREQITLKFTNIKDGYRYQDLTAETSTFNSHVYGIAVKDSVTVKGNIVGGMIGILTSGVVSNCYTRATINGASSSAKVAGMACDIKASGFDNYGGTGNAGVIIYSYSAVSFGGTGKEYAISSCYIHNHNAGNPPRVSGYVMCYYFDKDLAGNAEYKTGNNVWNVFGGSLKDEVKAKKSTSEMQTASTYASFSTAIWDLDSGYPTLNTER